jgi:lipoprotein-releasing system permease protein
MQFELKLAWRHLIHSGKQTILTVVAVAIAAMVVLFVQTMISGMQTRLMKDLVGSLSHVTIKPEDTLPESLERINPTSDSSMLLVSDQQPRLQQRTDIEQWESLSERIAAFPGVRMVTATVEGSAFVIRGSKRKSVGITGSNPPEFEQVSPVQKNIVAGRWLDLKIGEVVIGVKLADELRLQVGDRIVLQSAQNITQSFTVAGVFYAGNASDLSQVYMPLRDAQSLLATGQNVSAIQTKLEDAFRADQTAKELAAVLPYKVDSWMADSASILGVIQSQNAIRLFLTTCVLLASAVAVSAIMIVSVLQKNKQIGILKSMGARDKQILTVFTLEGLGIAIAGASIGVVLAVLAMNSLGRMMQPSPFGKKDAVFTIIYNPPQMTQLVLIVILATVIAAIFPARQAARLNPVEVIRG